ncbi:MAG: oxalate:formate antiporter [Polyangiales bacterium]
MIPSSHRAFVERALPIFQGDPRFVGVAAAGSWISGSMDEHSDVDLVAVVEESAFEAVMSERATLLARLGALLATFTGEHVGEPRVMISLYGSPLLHVDVKFVALSDFERRVENPVVLWERDGSLSRVIAASQARWPQPEWQWVEDRFWVWVHYGVTKIARGELFEALDFLSFLRSAALSAVASVAIDRPARGVRHLERDMPELAQELRATVASYDRASLVAALRATVRIYRSLREKAPSNLVRRSEAEAAAEGMLNAL